MSSAATEATPLASAPIGSSSTSGSMISAGLPPVANAAPAFEEDVLELAWVDDSVRVPVLLFFGSAILWLLLGTALKALAVLKLNAPLFLADFSWLTYGRLEPAANNALLYGWAASAGIGAALWIMARLCQARTRDGGVLTAAWALWNVALTLGVGVILNGQGTSYAGLEFPRFVSPLVFTAFVFIAIWPILLYRGRRTGSAYVAQWYILAAFFWFPWIYATANLALFFLPAQGAVQAVVATWYAHSLVAGCLIPLALAIAYYIVPKVLGTTVQHYRLAALAFWSWLLFSSWAGAYGLIGGPVPAWLLTVSIVANALTLLPVVAIVLGLSGPLKDSPRALRHSPSLRFVMVGVYCFMGATLLSIVLGFRSVNEITHFSEAATAQHELVFYAFVSFAFFGAIYYITPRLLGLEWASSPLLRVHFWFALVGVGLIVIGLALGGFIQGLGLDDAKVPPIAVLSLLKPFFATEFVAWLLLLVAHIALAASFGLMLLRLVWTLALRPATTVVPARTVDESLASVS